MLLVHVVLSWFSLSFYDLLHAHILFMQVNDQVSILFLFGGFFLWAELDRLSDHFQLLSALPATTRSSLLQHITKVMEDREAMGSLQSVVSGAERSCQYVDTVKLWS